MDFDLIKSHLLKDGYHDNSSTNETARRLLSLSGEPASMLSAWVENGTIPTFEAIQGVDSTFLIDMLHMKSPALIIAYAMLKDDPTENASYFKKLADNIIGFYPALNT